MEVFVFRIDNSSDMLYLKCDPKKSSIDGQYVNIFSNGSLLSFDLNCFDFVFLIK